MSRDETPELQGNLEFLRASCVAYEDELLVVLLSEHIIVPSGWPKEKHDTKRNTAIQGRLGELFAFCAPVGILVNSQQPHHEPIQNRSPCLRYFSQT